MSNKLHWKETVTVYLIHFDKSYKHAKHYLGSTTNFDVRQLQHEKGSGSRLLAAVKEAGIGWKVVRLWIKVPRYHETILHKMKRNKYLCPVCSGKIALTRGNHESKISKP